MERGKAQLVAVLSLVLGSLLVLSTVIAINQFTRTPEAVEVNIHSPLLDKISLQGKMIH